MKKVLVNKPIHEDAIKLLQTEVEVLTPFKAPPEEILKLLSTVQGMVLCVGFNVTAETLETITNLEVVGRHGVGLENIDVAAATRKGLPVTFTPEGPTESTAEHAFLLMTAVARKLTFLDRQTRAGNFVIRDTVVGSELLNKKVGVAGFGRIGQRFAEMCRDAFHMEIHAFDPFLPEDKLKAWGAIPHSNLSSMAAEVEFLSVHTPATAQTRHMVNADVLNALGKNGYLVNCARGPVVDEQALIAALQNGIIAGAAVDVYDPEPPAPNNPLFSLDNVVLTPHLASFTEEGRQRMGMMVAEDVLRVLRGEKPKYPANPEVFSK
jgi:D-3-phosphoglycerate dehydrogenase / 2-oxoglutarate reductase